MPKIELGETEEDRERDRERWGETEIERETQRENIISVKIKLFPSHIIENSSTCPQSSNVWHSYLSITMY